MKRKLLSILLCTAMAVTTVTGATTVLAEEKQNVEEKEWEYKEAELTFLIHFRICVSCISGCF